MMRERVAKYDPIRAHRNTFRFVMGEGAASGTGTGVARRVELETGMSSHCGPSGVQALQAQPNRANSHIIVFYLEGPVSAAVSAVHTILC
jgi:hypothetical protein